MAYFTNFSLTSIPINRLKSTIIRYLYASDNMQLENLWYQSSVQTSQTTHYIQCILVVSYGHWNLNRELVDHVLNLGCKYNTVIR